MPLYRYAEAILIYAEAQNELGKTGTAIQYLNMIRARVRNGTGGQSRTEPADYPNSGDTLGLRDAIFMERAWEFAFEAKRWFDLVRRDSEEPGSWANSLVVHDSISAALGDDQGVTRVSRATALTYKKRFPIPQGQIDANPALCQNPGYGGTACPSGVTVP